MSILDDYKKNGFVIKKGFFKKKTIESIFIDAKDIFRTQLIRFGANPVDLYSDPEYFELALYKLFNEQQEVFINCGKQTHHLVPLHRLSVKKKLIKMLERLGLENPIIATRPTMFFNSKHLATKDIYHTIPAHQDAASIGGSENSMVVWAPLIKVTEKLGALQVVPGSHTKGLLTTKHEEGFGLVSEFEDSDFISVELEPGDALFFSSYLVHRSGTNSTDNIRWSFHLRYNDLNDPFFIKNGYPNPYIYKPISKDVK